MFKPVALSLFLSVALIAGTALQGGEESHPTVAKTSAAALIGMQVPQRDISRIERTGLYGLGEPAKGMYYAIVGGDIVRMEEGTNILLGVVRPIGDARIND